MTVDPCPVALEQEDVDTSLYVRQIESEHLEVVVITTAQLNSKKPELSICTGSNPAGGMSEIHDGEDL